MSIISAFRLISIPQYPEKKKNKKNKLFQVSANNSMNQAVSEFPMSSLPAELQAGSQIISQDPLNIWCLILKSWVPPKIY